MKLPESLREQLKIPLGLLLPEKDADKAYTGLEKQLILHLAASLGFSGEDVKGDWDLHYFAKLVPEKARVADSQKFQDVVNHGLTGDFRDFILDRNSRYGKFNHQVLDEMCTLGLDTDRWYSYSDVTRFVLDSSGAAEEIDAQGRNFTYS